MIKNMKNGQNYCVGIAEKNGFLKPDTLFRVLNAGKNLVIRLYKMIDLSENKKGIIWEYLISQLDKTKIKHTPLPRERFLRKMVEDLYGGDNNGKKTTKKS